MLNILSKALQSAHLISSPEAEPTSTTNGVNLTIDLKTIESAAGSYWDLVEHRLNAITIPDLILPSDDSMYMKKNDFTIYQSFDHTAFNYDVARNAMCISM